MSEQLSAFAPLRCLDRGLLAGNSIFTREATVLFVDVAGFTPLTDRLARYGSRGTEELSQTLQHLFGQVTDYVLDLGGDPIAFGGDALTITFDGQAEATLEAAKISADAIQRLVGQASNTPTLAGPVTLETRIGIARGAVSTTVARSTLRAVPLQLGLGLDYAVAAESSAANGAVVLHDSTALSLTMTPTATVGIDGTDGIDVPSTSSAELARLVHPIVRGRLSAGTALLDSHRSITVAFLGFAPVAVDRITTFRRFLGSLLQVVDDCGGEVVQVSGGDKGVVALLTFGAPIGHDDDPLRAIQAVLELRRRDPSVRVGITTGPVFATLLGCPRRRFPAHFGRTLNMAARLMQAAQPRQILTDSPTWEASSTYLRQRGTSEFLRVKGMPEPIETHDLAGWRRRRQAPAATTDTLLVGREREVEALELLLDETSVSRGRFLTFEGEPGIGKSRLAREAVERAKSRAIEVFKVDADDYPYGQLSGLWQELLGWRMNIPAQASGRDWLAALSNQLPNQLGQLNVLSPLLGVTLGSQKARPELPTDVEAELAQSLVSEIIVGGRDDHALLVVIENVHHFDQSSLALLTFLGQQVVGSRVGIVTTRRAQSDQVRNPPGRAGSTLQLHELTREASATLIEDTWHQSGGGSTPSWLPDYVFHRAGGNPLFIQFVTRQTRRDWQPGEPPLAKDLEGESLASLLAERVDALEAQERQALNVLAVANRPCMMTTVAAVLSEQLDQAATAGAAQRLLAGNWVTVTFNATGELYRLRHNALQQVVYEQMSHAERRRIHRGLADHLSIQDADAREIADHVERLDDPNLARHWFPRAAASARKSWNIPEAVKWWRAALPLLTDKSRDEAEVELLEVLLVGGRANEALDLAKQRTAEGTTGMAPALVSRRHVATAEAALVCGDFARCEVECRIVMGLTDRRDEARQQRSAELLVVSFCERGKLVEAVTLAREQLERAALSGEIRSITTASASLGAALLWNGEPEAAAEHYYVARANAASSGDSVHEIHAISDLAGCAFATGDLTRCLELLSQARRKAEGIGYRRHLMVNLNNEAQLRVGLGDKHAAACAKLAFKRSLEMGDLTSAASCIHTWLSADRKLTNDVDAWRRLARADQRLSRDLAAAEDNAHLAVAAARSGDLETSRQATELALTHPDSKEIGSLARRIELARLIVRASSPTQGSSDVQDDVLESLEAMSRAQQASEVERAEFAMERWFIGQDEEARTDALAALDSAFAAEPSAVVRSWYQAIDAELPPLPEPLPPPVGIGEAETTNVELQTALEQLEAALDSSQLTGVRPLPRVDDVAPHPSVDEGR